MKQNTLQVSDFANAPKIQPTAGHRVQIKMVHLDISAATVGDQCTLSLQQDQTTVTESATGIMTKTNARVTFAIGLCPNTTMVLSELAGAFTSAATDVLTGGLPEVWWDRPVNLVADTTGGASLGSGFIMYDED